MLLRKNLVKLSTVGMAVLVSMLTSGAQVKAEETFLNQSDTGKVNVEYTVAQYRGRGQRTSLQRLYQQRSYYQNLARRWQEGRSLRYRICLRGGGSRRLCARHYWRRNPYTARILRINRQIWRLERGYNYY
jgi:hypothetical protein